MTKLKKIREDIKHKTLSYVAEKIGITPAYLSFLENKKRDPSIKILNKLANYYKDVSIYNDFIEGGVVVRLGELGELVPIIEQKAEEYGITEEKVLNYIIDWSADGECPSTLDEMIKRGLE